MRLRSWWGAHLLSLIAGCGLVAGCMHQPIPKAARPAAQKTTPPKKTRRPGPIKTVETIVVTCPSAADIKKLRAARPKPLRNQKMPGTAAERVAKTAAQLGLYEAKGRWADQVEQAFAKCEGN